MRSLKILHVDDSRIDLEYTSYYFMRNGNNVTIVQEESVEQALKLLEDDHFDCVLSDYKMPGKDGLQFLETLRAGGNEIPFVFLTGDEDKKLVARAMGSGANDFFRKSADPTIYESLIHSIEQLVELRMHRL